MNNIKSNEITIIYKTIDYNSHKYYDKIKLFGEEFVKNNKDHCKFIFDYKEYDLETELDIKNYESNKGIIEIYLINTQNITDASNMFYKCDQLLSLSDIKNWNISNITNISKMFYGCASLISFPDISNWDTSNIINMKELFKDYNYK